MRSTVERDVVIVGGGPVGLATSIHLARSGCRVSVLEARRPPLDKACGEGLLPAAVEELAALGIDSPRRLGRTFRGIRFVDRGRRVEGRFEGGGGLAVRRTRLQRALLGRARAVGVQVEMGTPVRSISDGRVLTDETAFGADWIVGADGARSRTAASSGLARQLPTCRFGLRAHFRVAPWSDCVEVYWGERCEAYLTPVGSEEVGLALLSPRPKLRLSDLPDLFPDLSRRLSGAQVSSRPRGASLTSAEVRRPASDRVALVGDASGTLDAIGGQGVTVGLLQARALAGAIAAAELGSYVAEHRRIMRLPSLFNAVLLAGTRHPRLRRTCFAMLGSAPRSFDRLLALHSATGRQSWQCRGGARSVHPSPTALRRLAE